MKDGFLINSYTKRQLDQFLISPGSVLLLTGSKGAGKKHLALQVAAQLVGGAGEKLINKGQILVLEAGAGIDEVRGVIREVSIKALARRAVIIQDADRLGHEAQNALLKTLEELPANTFFILTTGNPNSLLATIKSRATSIAVKPLSLEETKKTFAQLPAAETERAWLLGEGLAAQLAGLLSGESDQLINSAEAAKEFLGLDSYNRLLFLDRNISDRDSLLSFLNGLKRVLKAASLITAQKNNTNALNRLTTSRRMVMELMDEVNANASTKLVNLRLAISLKV